MKMSSRLARSNVVKDIKPRFLCGLYSDKPWVFDQSEHALGAIYLAWKRINLKVQSSG